MPDIYVPSTPRHLTITQTMVECLMFDPVMAAKVIMGIDLDHFQRARLRIFWWTPYVIDSSGFSTGKTIVDWILINLRCLLMPNHVALVYYQGFQAMKDTFFPYYQKCNSPIFNAQVGRLDKEGEERGRDTSRDPSCWKAFYKNGSMVMMPAPGFLTKSKSQAGRRCNDLLVDEFTKAESMNKDGSGIDDQLIGRVTMTSFNQKHPIWMNHMLFTATAANPLHPSYSRVRAFKRAIASGSPNHALISFSFKDWSNDIIPDHN